MEGTRRIFQMPEKSDDFGRIWTRELGVPEVSTLTTRPPKPSTPLITMESGVLENPDNISKNVKFDFFAPRSVLQVLKFSDAWKIRRIWPDLNPRTWGTRGQQANHQTTEAVLTAV